MKKMTIENIREHNPCYDPGRFLPENWTGTALDILWIGSCPAEDRLWVVTHPGWIDDIVLRQWMRWCALQVIDLWDSPDVVREYLKTGDEELQNAAWDAAWDAAMDADAASAAVGAAAWGAASTVARDAASDAARAAAGAVASDTARDAVWDVAWDATMDATRDAQMKKLIELLENLIK